MPDARITTASIDAVRRVAELALARPDGLAVNFTLADCGTLESCQARSRSFQTSFSSLRARVRRQLAANQTNRLDQDIPGRYDRLSCQRVAIPGGNGYQVLLYPVDRLVMELNVTDMHGMPLEELSPDKARLDAIIKFWSTQKSAAREGGRQFVDPLTDVERRWLCGYDLDTAKIMYIEAGLIPGDPMMVFNGLDMRKTLFEPLNDPTDIKPPKSIEEMFKGGRAHEG